MAPALSIAPRESHIHDSNALEVAAKPLTYRRRALASVNNLATHMEEDDMGLPNEPSLATDSQEMEQILEDLGNSDIGQDALLQAIKTLDSGGDTLSTGDGLSTGDTDAIFPLSGFDLPEPADSEGDAVEDKIKSTQVSLERRCLFLQRRLRILQARAIGKRVSEEVTQTFEKCTRGARRDGGGRPVGLKTFLKTVETTAALQANAASRTVVGPKYYNPGTSKGDASRSASIGIPSGTLSGLADTAGALHSHLSMVQHELDSDATASSSGAESNDEAVTYNNTQQLHMPLEKRALWTWQRARASIASRWCWLQAQVHELEYKIRQHDDLHRQVREAKGPVEFEGEPVGYEGSLPGSLTGALSDAVPGSLTGMLPDSQSGSLPDSLSGALPDSLSGALPDSLSGALPGSLPDSLSGALPGSLTGALPDSLSGALTDSLPGALPGSLSSSLPDLLSGMHRPSSAGPAFDSCARVRPLRRETFKKRKLLQMHNLHIATQKAARPSDIRCSCQQGLESCAVCTGRAEPTQPAAPFSTVPRQQRRAARDPGYHPVLSDLRDLPPSLHMSALAARGPLPRGPRARAPGVPPPAPPPHAAKPAKRHPGTRLKRGRPPLTRKIRDRERDDETSTSGHERSRGRSSTESRSWRRQSYDIDNIVIPQSVAANTRPQILTYKEIITPKWRVLEIPETPLNNGVMKANRVSIESEEEDISEAAVRSRHTRAEARERARYVRKPRRLALLPPEDPPEPPEPAPPEPPEPAPPEPEPEPPCPVMPRDPEPPLYETVRPYTPRQFPLADAAYLDMVAAMPGSRPPSARASPASPASRAASPASAGEALSDAPSSLSPASPGAFEGDDPDDAEWAPHVERRKSSFR